MIEITKSIYKEGGIRSFYRGIQAPIFAEAPKRAWKFGANDFFKGYGLSPMLAGAAAGGTEAFVNCQFETVKVNMQGNQSFTGGSLDMVKKIVRESGLTGIYRGLEAQIYRNCLWNGIYFGVIGAFPANPESTKAEQLSHKFTFGTLGSILGTIANTPFDVAKSRMQFGGNKSCFPTLMEIYNKEGMASLYKGIGARLLRLGPGGGIMIVAYDFFMELMKDW